MSPSAPTPPEPAADRPDHGDPDPRHDNVPQDREPLPTAVKLAAVALVLVIAGRVLGWGSGDDSDPLPVAVWCAAGVVLVAAAVHALRARRARHLTAQVRRATDVLASAPMLTTPDAVTQLAASGVSTQGLGTQGGRLVLAVANAEGVQLWRAGRSPERVAAWPWPEVTLRTGSVRLGVRNPPVLDIATTASTLPLLPAGGGGMWFPPAEVERVVAALEGARPT